jgi:glycosyltransferase involved in cell wall biosynthesis
MAPECLLVHPSLNFAGGAERQSILVTRELLRLGFDCVLLTMDKPKEEILETKLGLRLPSELEIWSLNDSITVPELSVKEFLDLLTKFIRKLKHLSGEKLPKVLLQAEFDLLTPYVDVLYFQAIPFSYSGFKEYSNVAPRFLKASIFRKLYWMINYPRLQRILKRKIVWTNSRFLARVLGIKPRAIVHPVLASIPRLDRRSLESKERVVLSIGRFVSSKGYQLLIPAAKHALASSKYKLVIAGRLQSEAYYRWIKRLKERFNLTNLDLLPNPSFKEIQELYRRSSIFVNPMKNEAFGLTVLEAMAHGCVPLVNVRSGAWTDLLMEIQGKYGYGFSNLSELYNVLLQLINEEDKIKQLYLRAYQRAKEYSSDLLRKELSKATSDVL